MNLPEHKKCQNSENCTGPGCRRQTGKTARKSTTHRPRPNKNNTQDVGISKGGKR